MPEGPEIRLAADRIAKVLVGRTVVDVEFGLPALKCFENRLAGNTVTAVDTRGKAMLTRFDNGLTVYSHNQLYGRWFTTRRPALPKTGRQLRLALHTSTRSALLYSASDISVLTSKQLKEHPLLRKLGPDILDPGLTSKLIAERLRESRFINRSLGSLYLDQGFLAGHVVTVAYSLLHTTPKPVVEHDGNTFELHPVDPKANRHRKRPARQPNPQPAASGEAGRCTRRSALTVRRSSSGGLLL